MKNVYVIRWLERVDGDIQLGNLDVCYGNAEDAFRQMEKEFLAKKALWELDVCAGQSLELDTSSPDYRSIEMPNPDTDLAEWWVDKLELSGGK